MLHVRAALTALFLLLAIPAAATAQASLPAWAPVAGLPLTEPDQIHPVDGVVRVALDARRHSIEVSGSSVYAQPFNGKLIGPTIHVRPGDTIEVTYRNGTPEQTNIHFHGMHVSPKGTSDNVFRTFEPNRTYTSVVRVPRDHSPGTYWYHAHMHGNTEQQVMGGMSGLIVVEGLEELLPQELRGITQRQIAFRDVQVLPDAPGVITPTDAEIFAGGPLTQLVNGLLKPRTALRSGETQLWRLANVGADLFYEIQLPGHRFTVIAEDGSPVWRVESYDKLILPPGKRYDVLVTGGAPGSYSLSSQSYAFQAQAVPRTDVLALDVLPASGTDPQAVIPATLDTPAGPITDRPVAKKRTFTFSFTSGPEFARINGKAFDPNVTNVAPRLNTVEQWTLRNTTTEDHPFHIHVNDFQVISINGRRHKANNLQDVVVIPPKRNGKAGEVVVRIPFDQFPGHFVFHCHILDHEDGGMMATVQVRRKGAPKTPPPHAMKGSHMRMVAATGPSATSPSADADRSRRALLCRLRRDAVALREV